MTTDQLDERMLQALVFDRRRRTIADPEQAADALAEALDRRVKRLWEAAEDRRLWLMLSGGVDSGVLAARMASGGESLVALTVASELGTELEHATATASHLDLSHRVVRVGAHNRESLIRRALGLLGTSDLYDVAYAVMMMAVAREMSVDADHHVLVDGGGADAFFDDGGASNMEELEKKQLREGRRYALGQFPVADLHERLDLVEPHRPYVSPEVVEVATQCLPEALSSSEWGDKAPIRALARRHGLPTAARSKDAMQWSSGVVAEIAEWGSDLLGESDYGDSWTDPVSLAAALALAWVEGQR